MAASNFPPPNVSPIRRGGEPNLSPATIQAMLDENVKLIHNMIAQQRRGASKEAAELQQALHRNLVYLATIADRTTSSTSTAGPPVNGGPPPPPQPGPPPHTTNGYHPPPASQPTAPNPTNFVPPQHPSYTPSNCPPPTTTSLINTTTTNPTTVVLPPSSSVTGCVASGISRSFGSGAPGGSAIGYQQPHPQQQQQQAQQQQWSPPNSGQESNTTTNNTSSET